jgi:rod shape-determining protein MreC
VTSGYNSIFPENITIGFIEDYALQTDSFYDIDVVLSNDFSSLAYVYIVRNPRRVERKDLESDIIPEVE